MADVEVIWTDNALIRLQNILGYYLERNDSNTYALKIQAEVDRILMIVQAFPGIGKLVDDGKTRIVLVEKFELLYEVIEEGILVIDFWDPKRTPGKRKDLQE